MSIITKTLKRLGWGLMGAVGFGMADLGAYAAGYPEFPYLPTNYDEPYRGQFHFSAQGGWMNDVNGLWYYKGEYHMTFQHFPHGLGWNQMHWGHAVSPDMLHWVQKPIALEPDVNVPGQCFSGSVVVDSANTSGFKSGNEDVFVAIYTATKKGTCLAYSNDKGATWQAYAGNPVAIGTTNEKTRDPHVFWHEPSHKWVAAEFETGRGMVFYNSPDLKTWTETSAFKFGDECPDIFELPVNDGATKKWVLHDGGGRYHLGSFDGAAFTPDVGGPWKIDANPERNYYASQSFFRKNFPDNRVIQMAWSFGKVATAPWTHNATFPCEFKLKTFPEGVRITRNPISEIARLYDSSQHWGAQTLAAGSNLLSGTKAKCFDLTAEFDLTGATATAIQFTLPNKIVTYNIPSKTLLGQALEPSKNRVKVRLLVDWSQLEVFGNDGKFSWTENVAFAPDASSIGLSVDGNVKLVAMDFHRVKSAWPAPLPPHFKTNLTGTWTPLSGTWKDYNGGKVGSGNGRTFCLNSQSTSDFTYEGDITILGFGRAPVSAGALAFRANANMTAGYSVYVDTGGTVGIWAPQRDMLARYATEIKVDTPYHLKVVTSGSNIKVYFNNSKEPVINFTDPQPFLGGQLGLAIVDGAAVFQNVNLNGGQ